MSNHGGWVTLVLLCSQPRAFLAPRPMYIITRIKVLHTYPRGGFCERLLKREKEGGKSKTVIVDYVVHEGW